VITFYVLDVADLTTVQRRHFSLFVGLHIF